MDRRLNPFAPGAGTRPPELAGRDDIIENATIALARVKAGRSAKSQMLLGLRGVGKTVLLNEIARIAETEGYRAIELEAPEDRRLAEMLVPPLRSVINKLSTLDQAKALATKALRGLQTFASVFKVGISEIEVGVAEPGLADSGSLENDLPDLLRAVAEAARAAHTPVAILIDEVQYLNEEDLRALIVAVHKVGQRQLPLIVFGAGLPQLAALTGEAKSYAERLFEYPGVGALDKAAAERAIREPLRSQNVDIDRTALARIVAETQGYPYSCRSGGLTSGMKRLALLSRSGMQHALALRRCERWTRASSTCDSIGSRHVRRTTSARWRSSAPDRTARVTSQPCSAWT